MNLESSHAPGPPWVDVAASAYRAYAASTGNKNFRGDPMPTWDQLPQPIRTAWEAAVRQAGSVLRGDSYGLDTEQRWTGWVPPHLTREPDGIHHYPCKPVIFAASYEPVQPSRPPNIDRDRPCCECGESYVCNLDDPNDDPVWCPKCRLLPHCQPRK